MWAADFRHVLRGLAGALFTACATNGLAPPARDARVITSMELRRTQAGHAYEAVQLLRPEFLWGRGPSTPLHEASPGPAVFVDRMFLGPSSTLVDIPIGDVLLIRFIPAWDAATTYGRGYGNGVIEVTTRRGGS